MKPIIAAVMVTIYYSKIFYYYVLYCTRQNFHGTTNDDAVVLQFMIFRRRDFRFLHIHNIIIRL